MSFKRLFDSVRNFFGRLKKGGYQPVPVVIVPPSLAALTLSSASFVAVVPSSGTVLGATSGSVIVVSALPPGLVIDGAARTWSWVGSSGSDGSFTLTETLSGYSNSPRVNIINYTIALVSAEAPSNTVLPKFVDGLGDTVTAPIVGQQLFINVGTWTNAPTTFSWVVYDDAGAILDAFDTSSGSGEDYYIVYDAEIGRALHISVIASNGLSSLEALSTATSAVVDRSIAKPTLTRTSASGVTPMTFSIGLGSGVFVGDEIHIQVCSDSTFDPSLITQDIYYVLTEADLQTPFTPDLSACAPSAFSSPTALQYLRVFADGRTPQGRVITSPVSDSISPTDAVPPVMFNPADKTASVTLSNGNLTASANTNAQGVRATRGGTAKWYWEGTIDVVSGIVAIGVCDAGEGFVSWMGDADTKGACYTTDGTLHYGGGSSVAVATLAAADKVGVAYDPVNKLVWFAKNNTWLNSGNPAAGTGGLSVGGASGTVYPAAQFYYGSNGQCTAKFAAAFTYTPPTGFAAIP